MNLNFKQVLKNTQNSTDSTSVQKVLNDKSDKNKKILSASKNKNVVKQPEPKIKCKLYNDEVFPSINFEKENFINFLPEKILIDDKTNEQIDFIAKDESCIYRDYDKREAPPVRYSGNSKNHILEIIKEYEKKFGCTDNFLEQALKDGRIRKTTVPEGNSKGKLRVISLYEKNLVENQTYFYLLFVDFYHLFVPSGHNGIDAVTTSRRMYNDYKSNDTHVYEVLKKENIAWLSK